MNQQNWEIILGTWAQLFFAFVTMVFMTALYLSSEGVMWVAIWCSEQEGETRKHLSDRLRRVSGYLSVLNLWVALGFWGVIAFWDHIIHRAGLYLGKTDWETWRAGLHYDKLVVTIFMVVALLPITYLATLAEEAISPSYSSKKGKVAVAVLYLLIGAIAIAVSRVM